MTRYSLDVLLFLFGTSLLFHVKFWLLLPYLHTGFSTGRSGTLVFPCFSEFSTADVTNLISGSSAFSKSSLYIWKFLAHILLKPSLEDFEHDLASECCCSSVSQSCLILCEPMDCSMPGFPVFHFLPELAQTHIHWVGDAIQPSYPLLSPFPPAFNLSQHQGLS